MKNVSHTIKSAWRQFLKMATASQKYCMFLPYLFVKTYLLFNFMVLCVFVKTMKLNNIIFMVWCLHRQLKLCNLLGCYVGIVNVQPPLVILCWQVRSFCWLVRSFDDFLKFNINMSPYMYLIYLPPVVALERDILL